MLWITRPQVCRVVREMLSRQRMGPPLPRETSRRALYRQAGTTTLKPSL